MRFDYFESFWNEYKVFLESIKIDKEILKQVYNYNAETLIPTKKPNLMDALNGQEYEVSIISDNDKKSLIIKPFGKKQENYKMISIDNDFIKIFNMDSNGIGIEKYGYKSRNINLKLYDNKAVSYLEENNYLNLFEPNKVDSQMKKLHLEPDVELSVIARSNLPQDVLNIYNEVATLNENSEIQNKLTETYTLNYRLEKAGEPYFNTTSQINNISKMYTDFQIRKKEFKLEEILNQKIK